MSEETSKVYNFGDGNTSALLSMMAPLLSQRGIDATQLAAICNRNGGILGNGNDLIALIVIVALFGGGFGGFGGFGAGRGAGIINNDFNTNLLMDTLNRNGVDINALAQSLNVSTNTVVAAINSIGTQIGNVGNQVGLSGQQIINSVERGQANLAAQLAQCCCENKLLVTNQGYENRIANLEQTGILGTKIDGNTVAFTKSIGDLRSDMHEEFCGVKMREYEHTINDLRDRLNTANNQLSNEHQTNAIQQSTAAMIAPINAALAGIQKEVSDLQCKMPSTTTIPYSPVVGVPSCVAWNYGLYQNPMAGGGSYWG